MFFHEIDHLDGILFTDKIEEPESKPSQSKQKDKRSKKRLMRVAFFGTPDFAVNSLRRLIESGREIVAVVCPARQGGQSRQNQLLCGQKLRCGKGTENFSV